MRNTFKQINIFLMVLFLLFSFLIANSKEKLEIHPYLYTNGINQGGTFNIAVNVIIKDGWHINSNQPLDEFLIASELNITESDDFKIEKIKFPEPKIHKNDQEVVEFFEKSLVVLLTGKMNKSVENNVKLEGDFLFQACSDRTCLAPKKIEFSIDIPILAESEVETNSDNMEFFSSLEIEDNQVKGASFFTIIKFLLMAFIGGIILNVMPCVLPVLSIKAMSIVKQSQQDKKMIMKSSLVYTAGILVSFIVLALVIIILKMSGELVGWGFQFQSPGFVIFLLTIIFVFALSLFDVFIFQAPGMQVASQMTAKGGLTGSFMSGIFAVLLATPCTAPILGAALGFAFSQPPFMILAIFLLVGFGLAFPFILLGFWPGAIKLIPKPGEWMNTFKEFMGFLLFGTALFLLRTVYFLIGGENTIMVLWFLIFLALAVWIYGRFAGSENSLKKQWIATILAIVIGVTAGIKTLNFEDKSNNLNEINLHVGWEQFSPEYVDKLRAEEKPVFIDFSAEWCLTCKTNEKTVLHTEQISRAFEEKNVTLLYGDNTKKDEIIGQWLRKFGRAGVPLYIFYIPGQEEPVVLPELITKKMVLDMLKQLD